MAVKRSPFGLRRIAIWLAVIVLLYFGGGMVAGAFVLQHLLTIGNVDWSEANNPNPPTDPLVMNYRGDPRVAFGWDFETISYRTALGDAEAWLVPAAKPSNRWAIFVHGIGGIRENGYKQLVPLHEAGLPVLTITYRGDSTAPANPDGLYSFGLTEWRDLESAVLWARQHGAAEIVLVAESMGAAIAGQFLAHSPEAMHVKALVLDAPATDVTAVVASKLSSEDLPFGRWIATGALWGLAQLTGVDLRDADVREALAAFPRPMFLTHGTGDLLVPYESSRQLAAARSGVTEFLTSGAGHLRTFEEDRERYSSALLAFLTGLNGQTETAP